MRCRYRAGCSLPRGAGTGGLGKTAHWRRPEIRVARSAVFLGWLVCHEEEQERCCNRNRFGMQRPSSAQHLRSVRGVLPAISTAQHVLRWCSTQAESRMFWADPPYMELSTLNCENKCRTRGAHWWRRHDTALVVTVVFCRSDNNAAVMCDRNLSLSPGFIRLLDLIMNRFYICGVCNSRVCIVK